MLAFPSLVYFTSASLPPPPPGIVLHSPMAPSSLLALLGMPYCTAPSHGASSKSWRTEGEPGDSSWNRAQGPQLNPAQVTCGLQATSWTAMVQRNSSGTLTRFLQRRTSTEELSLNTWGVLWAQYTSYSLWSNCSGLLQNDAVGSSFRNVPNPAGQWKGALA